MSSRCVDSSAQTFKKRLQTGISTQTCYIDFICEPRANDTVMAKRTQQTSLSDTGHSLDCNHCLVLICVVQKSIGGLCFVISVEYTLRVFLFLQ